MGHQTHLNYLRDKVGNLGSCLSIGDQATQSTIDWTCLLEVLLQRQCSCTSRPDLSQGGGKEKRTTPFGADLTRSLVTHQAAQTSVTHALYLSKDMA